MIPLWLWLAYTVSASVTGIYLYRLGAEIGYDKGYKDGLHDDYQCEDYNNDRPFDQFETRAGKQNTPDQIYGSTTGYI